MTARPQGRGDHPPAGWVWPEWLEGQLDPRSASFRAAEQWPRPVNRSARNWTALGTVASPYRAVVDQRGLLTLTPGGWSLDWWIGAEDRWHFPSRDHAVRQRLVAGTPVVETAMRVPGGDAVHRVYAVRAPQGPPVDELVVVEIHNQTSVPFAVALAVRPYNSDGLSEVHGIDLDDGVVTVDGRVGLLFDRAPRLVAGSSLSAGDSAAEVTAGAAHPPPLAPVRCAAGLAQAAFLYPLAHTAVLRLCLPLGPPPAAAPAGRWSPGLVARLPAAADAARSWQAQTDRGLRAELPPGRLADAWAANRRALLLTCPAPAGPPGRPARLGGSFRDGAGPILALDRLGFPQQAAELITAGAGGQSRDGRLPEPPGDRSATGVWLWTLAEHWRMTGDRDLLGQLGPAVARAAAALGREGPARRRRVPRLGSRAATAGPSGPLEPSAWDARWRSRGLREASLLLAAIDDPARPPHPVAPGDSVVAAGLGAIRAELGAGPACPPAGAETELSPYLTARVAAVELEAGDGGVLDRLAWLLGVASATWTWPELVDSRSGRGCRGDGHDGSAGAAFCSLVRDLLVRETPGGLALLSVLPTGWLGQGIEVHGAPTHAGALSYAVRWHAGRPALLWELHPRPDAPTVRLTAPGLDPGWSSEAAVGEALLAAPAGPAPVGGTFG